MLGDSVPHPRPSPGAHPAADGAPGRLAQINSDRKSAPVLPAPDGVEIRLVNPRLRAFARTPYDRLFVDLATIDAAEVALDEGCEALYVDSFADYGVEAIRALGPVPVTGAGEAAIAAAAAWGTFSIVTVWPPSMSFLYDDRLRSCSGGDRCRGVHFFSAESELDRLGSREGVQARMRRTEPALLDRLAEACDAAAEADGSDSILLGCTCMSPVAAELARRCAVPVLDAAEIGLATAIATLAPAPAPAPCATSTTSRAGDVRRLVDAWMAAATDRPDADATDSECAVCAFDATADREETL